MKFFYKHFVLVCLSTTISIFGIDFGTKADEAANRDQLAFEPSNTGKPIAQKSRSLDSLSVDPPSALGQGARGLYFNGPLARRLGAAGLIRIVHGASLNAVVIDVKDGEGRVFWDSQIEVLQPQKRPFKPDIALMIGELKAAGVYTIARVVCFSDPKLPRNFPDRAIMDGRPNKLGQLWANWKRRNTWLDPYHKSNHQLLVEIAKEIETIGFDEIQLDYFRFPVDEATSFALYPARTETPKQDVLLDILSKIDAAIDIPIGVDVFGVTAFYPGDREGLGQVMDSWAAHVEVFSPMLYLNSMRNWLKGTKEQRALRLVQSGVSRLRRRLGHGPVIRPFLQAYSRGADYYTPEFIAEQIQASRQGGADGFLFWHPDSDYKLVRQAMGGAAHGLSPFPNETREAWRREHFGQMPEKTPVEEKAQQAEMATDTEAEKAIN
jgi:hypothetical protein